MRSLYNTNELKYCEYDYTSIFVLHHISSAASSPLIRDDVRNKVSSHYRPTLSQPSDDRSQTAQTYLSLENEKKNVVTFCQTDSA